MVRPYLPREVSHAAAQRQTADAGGGNDSGGHSQSEGMRGMIDIAPCAAAADAHGSRGRIDMNKLDRGEIDHQAIVADSQAAGVMAAAANGDLQVMLTAEVNGRHHVGHVGAFAIKRGLRLDHGVIDLALCVVTRIVRLDQVAPKLAFEFCKFFSCILFLRDPVGVQ